MKHAIIDIGSNSMHLCVYETQGKNFKILFRDKQMAGLASYIKKDALNSEGIDAACRGLLYFKSILDTLEIENTYVFATAALRNIHNTNQVITIINSTTGYTVRVISGAEEALLSYIGAMQELDIDDGAFLDVGGGSTEVVIFDGGEAIDSTSIPIGSLNLSRSCVKRIFPNKDELKDLNKEIKQAFKPLKQNIQPHNTMVGVGGTARAILKLINLYFHNDDDNNEITIDQLMELYEYLTSGSKKAMNLILRTMPERIHTIIPGLMIIQYLLKIFEANNLIVSPYGVREGYLLERVLNDEEIY